MTPPPRPRQSPSPDPAPSPELLLSAYLQGAFPMADPDSGRILWYSPDPRGVLPLDGSFRVPGTVGRLVRQGRFEIVRDRDFIGVMRACAAPRPGEDGTWIDERLIGAYGRLHESGFAHSIEAWRDGRRGGGLYGVRSGAAFFGESMFIRPELGGSGASKVCLVRLVDHLRAIGGRLLDTQFTTEHLERFGAREIPRETYLRRLAEALKHPTDWDTGPIPAG